MSTSVSAACCASCLNLTRDAGERDAPELVFPRNRLYILLLWSCRIRRTIEETCEWT